MAYLNFYQNSQVFKKNKINDIERVSSRIKESFTYITEDSFLQGNSNPEQINDLYDNRVFELANVFNTNINVYDLKGNLIASNRQSNGVLNAWVLKNVTSEKKIVIDSTG